MAATAEQLERWSRELLKIVKEMEEVWPEDGGYPPQALALTHYAWCHVYEQQQRRGARA